MTAFFSTVDWIIIGSDRQPETNQGIKGKIVRFRSGRVRDRVRDKDHRSEPDRRSEPNVVLVHYLLCSLSCWRWHCA